jgi:hypothetical protein
VHDYPFISVQFYQNTVCVTKSIGDGWCSVCLIGGGNLTPGLVCPMAIIVAGMGGQMLKGEPIS